MKFVPVNELDFRIEPYDWEWPKENREAIDTHFARLLTQRSQIWNGRILMMRDYRIEGEKISGTFFETDYANLLCLRAMGYPDRNVFGCAASVALRTADDAYMLGVMAPSTANGGRIYFIAGTPDLSDVRADGRVDLVGSTVRELGEEVGLSESDVHFPGGWYAVLTAARLELVRTATTKLTEEALFARIRRYIASQENPELADVVSVRSSADYSPAMPDFICSYLDAMLKKKA